MEKFIVCHKIAQNDVGYLYDLAQTIIADEYDLQQKQHIVFPVVDNTVEVAEMYYNDINDSLQMCLQFMGKDRCSKIWMAR